jgi:beta-lactam-binding protein with PASTA domain
MSSRLLLILAFAGVMVAATPVVISQHPAPRTRLLEGSKVNLVVSRGRVP